jgi:hypothetical protein
MAAVVASPEELDQVADDLYKKVEEMAEVTQQLGQVIKGGIGENWVDENGVTFQEKYDEVEKDIPRYLETGALASGFMKGVSNAYREVANLAQKSVQGNGE